MNKKLFVWLQVIVAATLLGVVTGNLIQSFPKNDKKAKYIFLFIGDGMGFSQVSAAESYLSYKNGKAGGEQLLMTSFPAMGMATTYSANRQVTGSAASGTAIACGQKTNNGMVGMNADSVAISSIAYDLQADGYRIGIVTSVPLNHATPVGFYAHNINRANEYEMGLEIPESGFDFFAGSGLLKYYGRDNDQTGLDKKIEEGGYTLCFGMDEFKAESAEASKLVLCQADAEGKNAAEYLVCDTDPVDGTRKSKMSLRDMLEAGLEFLSDKEPFFIMCEGGEIDWAGHFNMVMPMMESMLEFDDAIAAAYEFYLQHPDETLIVVTADHETGGLSLGRGTGKPIDWERLEKAWIESHRSYDIDNDKIAELHNECRIGWTAHSHTGAHVPVFAVGQGAERFCGRMDNTEIKGKILCK